MKPIILLLLAFWLASCAPPLPSTRKGTVDHIVLVWLKRPGHQPDRTKLIRAADRLREIPGVVLLDAGTPLPSSRPMVDDSFDVAFMMRFSSTKALADYQTHPAHTEALVELRSLSGRVLIYDITR